MQKQNLIGPVLGEVRFFRVVLRLHGMKKEFEIGQKIFFFFIEPILVFPKFDPLTASEWLYVLILGQNVKIYSA